MIDKGFITPVTEPTEWVSSHTTQASNMALSPLA